MTARLERMRYDLEQRRLSHWIGLLSRVMNWMAFCGYCCIILPHFVPSPRVYRWLPFWVGHQQMLVRPQTLSPIIVHFCVQDFRYECV